MSVKTALFSIEMNIDRDFDSFSEQDKQTILKRIQELLEMQSPPDHEVRRGSVVLEVSGLTAAQAERLRWAIERGDFDDAGVSSATLKTLLLGGSTPARKQVFGELKSRASLLQQQDPIIWEAIEAEAQRQQDGLELIASENYTSLAVMQAAGNVLTNPELFTKQCRFLA